MGTSQKKKRYLKIDEMRSKRMQECKPNKTRLSLGDWNAGKEEDKLARPELRCPQGFVQRKEAMRAKNGS